MSRSTRQSLVLAKIESTYATDATPTGSANAMLTGPITFNPINPSNVARDRIRGYRGGSEELLGTRYSELGFNVELAGSGTAGTAPVWAPLLRMCGFDETVTSSERVTYGRTLDGDDDASCTLYGYDSGVLHKLLGARANASIKVVQGELPVLDLKTQGAYSTPTAASVPTGDFSDFVTPLIPTDSNTANLVLGGTLVAPGGTPAITGGTAMPSFGLELDIGNKVTFSPMIGQEETVITDWQAVGKVTFSLTAAEEVTYAGIVEDATTTSFGLIHGTTAGNKVMIWLPSVQLTNYTKTDRDMRRYISYDLRALPDATGVDVYVIVF